MWIQWYVFYSIVNRPVAPVAPVPRAPPAKPTVPVISSLCQLKDFKLSMPSHWREPLTEGQKTHLYRQAYRFHKALIYQKMASCINVK